MVVKKRLRDFVLILVACCLVILWESRALGYVRVIGQSEVNIKPNQAAFFLVEIERDHPRSEVELKELASSLLERVTVNDRAYGLGFGGGFNMAAALLGDGDWLREHENESDSFQATLVLFFDLEDKKFLFEVPGKYEVSLGDEIHVTVIVEEPTQEEAVVAEKINELGVEFIVWVLEGGDGHKPELTQKVERLLDAHPNTVYSEMLSVCLGASKLREARDYSNGVESADRRWSEVVAKYFAPYANTPIRSPFQATATFQLGRHALEVEASSKASDENTRRLAKKRARTLFERVSNSPYSTRFRNEAQNRVKELEE